MRSGIAVEAVCALSAKVAQQHKARRILFMGRVWGDDGRGVRGGKAHRSRWGGGDGTYSARVTRRVPSGSSSMSTLTALSGNSGSMSSGHSMKQGAPE